MDNTYTVIEPGGVTSPKGFLASGVAAGLKESNSLDMALIFSEKPAVPAGAFTSCLFKSGAVILCEDRLKEHLPVQAVIINSGNANSCTGEKGYENALKMSEITAECLDIAPENVLVSSTGKIGTQLPMDKIESGIRSAVESLSFEHGGIAAKAIMTTDTRPKSTAVSVDIDGMPVVIGGMAKGSGMIAPQLQTLHATMLGYITTDAGVERPYFNKLVFKAINRSFNRITVDGDMSTNDTVIALANGCSGVKINEASPGAAVFENAFIEVCEHLAKELVRDGEGVTKFVSVEVVNAATEKDADVCARAIANSLLCKTAWFGNDPNWGRILMAAGYSGADFSPDNFNLDFNDIPVVRNGVAADTSDETLLEAVRKPEFTVRVDLNCGDNSSTIWTNDISYEYVKINAEYHT